MKFIKEFLGLTKELIETSEFMAGVIMVLCLYSAISFVCGTLSFHHESAKDCKAQSIMELVNVPYRVGCELTKQRWE